MKPIDKRSHKRGRALCALPLFLFLILAAGCASTGPAARLAEIRDAIGGSPESGALIEGVPFYPQKKFMCGPASLAGVLNYYGAGVEVDEVEGAIFTKEVKGALLMDMLLYAKERGMSASLYSGSLEDLKAKLRRGSPLILLLNLGASFLPAGHYIVVTGYDDRSESVVANSGRKESKRIGYGRLLRAWSLTDYTAILVTPGPDSFDERLGLAEESEESGDLEGALTGYAELLDRDGRERAALYFRMGNILLKLDHNREAIARFESAIMQELRGEYVNNLAFAYLKAGELERAERAAKRAISIDPSKDFIYLETLGSIEMAAGRFPQAELSLKKALSRLPEGEREGRLYILGSLAELYRKSGEAGREAAINELIEEVR